MAWRPAWRAGFNWANGATLAGLAVARLGGAECRRGPDGVFVAGGYRLPVPAQPCFTVGSVIVSRRPTQWLLDPRRAELMAHEVRHVGQYALLGPLFLPAYLLACGYSYTLTGSYGCRNVFERRAGLSAGGYREVPLRPWALRVRATVTRRPPD